MTLESATEMQEEVLHDSLVVAKLTPAKPQGTPSRRRSVRVAKRSLLMAQPEALVEAEKQERSQLRERPLVPSSLPLTQAGTVAKAAAGTTGLTPALEAICKTGLAGQGL